MTLSHEAMIELMQFADGELDAEARVRVEALLESSAEARGVVDAMGTLGEVVREGIEERASTSGRAADGIADGVMAAIATAAAEGREARGGDRNVVPFAPSRPALPVPRKVRAGGASAVVAVLALAAGVVLFARSKEPTPSHGDLFASAPPSAISGPAASSAASKAIAQIASSGAEAGGVDLEEVRSIRNKVNVFFTPAPPTPTQGTSARASVVVWIDDSDDNRGEH